MRQLFFLSVLLLLGSRGGVLAQDSDLINISIRVVNKENQLPIPFAQVVSYKEVKVFQANEKGFSYPWITPNDSLKIVSMGFISKVLNLSDFTNHDSLFVVELQQQNYLLESVDVYRKLNLHLPDDVKLGEGKAPDAMKNSVIAAPKALGLISNPISTLGSFKYYSRQEKKKRKGRELMYGEERKRDHDYLLLNREVIQQTTGLEGKELESFIVYCNIHVKVEAYDTEVDVQMKIQSAYNSFLKGEK